MGPNAVGSRLKNNIVILPDDALSALFDTFYISFAFCHPELSF